MKASGLALYLYCLTPSGGEIGELAAGLAAGVDGLRPVRSSARGEFCTIYSEVELADFAGPAAEAHLQDLAWLGPRVCRHEAVIEQVMTKAPVLPARFATLFSSRDSLDRFLRHHRQAIAAFFTELGARQEWAVKGLLDRAGGLRKLFDPAAETLAGPPGTRYFEEKRIKSRLEREYNQRLKEFCQAAAAELGSHAGGFRERKVLPSAAGAIEAEAILNWAFLISPEAVADFTASLERFNCGEAFPGLELVLSGPWPSYSFVPDLSGGDEA